MNAFITTFDHIHDNIPSQIFRILEESNFRCFDGVGQKRKNCGKNGDDANNGEVRHFSGQGSVPHTQKANASCKIGGLALFIGFFKNTVCFIWLLGR